MNTLRKDYKPETASLLNRLLSAGWAIVRSDIGDGSEKTFTTVEETVEHLTAVDESYLYVEDPKGRSHCLWLVFGTFGRFFFFYTDTADHAFDAILDAHYAEWEEKEQPMLDVKFS